ncbi:MAG: hypothetical protein M3275_00075 [Thermoproteota archaeon]|nr:hypothetical protein [Thermoproteota archaeon]
MGRRTTKKQREEYLIKWRRQQVAAMTYEGVPVSEQAEKLHVDERTIFRDKEFNEEHADQIMREYIVKTVPNIIAKALYQIDFANQQCLKILKSENGNNKDKLAASLAVAKTAKDVVDIVTNNKEFVDAALELDESQRKEAEEYLYNNGISTGSIKTETETEDSNRKF